MILTTAVFYLASVLAKRRSSSSSSSSSSSCSSSSESRRKLTFASYNFINRSPTLEGPDADFAYFEVPDLFKANDGVYTFGTKKQGSLISNPFKLWVPSNATIGDLDHYKFLILSKDAIPVLPNGSLVLRMDLSAKISVGQPPFLASVVQSNDVRFANAFFTAIDMEQSFSWGFLLTNDRVYAVVQRSKLGRTVFGPDAAAFAYIVPLKKRKPCNVNRCEIIFYEVTRQISFKVDGKDYYRIYTNGFIDRIYAILDQGGVGNLVWPSSLVYGFGTTSLLDYYPVCKSFNGCEYPLDRQGLVYMGSDDFNPITGPPTNATWYDPIGIAQGSHIWGQGVSMQMKKLEAYILF